MRFGWLINEDNFERAMSLRNGPHLPTTTQCACADFGDFAKQRNCGGAREKDLLALDQQREVLKDAAKA
jgi:hypothetical protein